MKLNVRLRHVAFRGGGGTGQPKELDVPECFRSLTGMFSYRVGFTKSSGGLQQTFPISTTTSTLVELSVRPTSTTPKPWQHKLETTELDCTHVCNVK